MLDRFAGMEALNRSFKNTDLVRESLRKREALSDLVQDSFQGKSLLLRGASGWFGHALKLLLNLKEMPLVVERNSGGDRLFRWGEEIDPSKKAEGDFDFCVDAAYVTRDNPRGLTAAKLEEANAKLNESALGLISSGLVGRYIGFSSGAALGDEGSLDAYGRQKRNMEKMFLQARRPQDTLLRIYSVSGARCSKPKAFAFSDFITQALQGDLVKITASQLVFRRYCAIEEMLALAIASSQPRGIVDSGGISLEVGSLAESIVQTLNPAAKIHRPPLDGEQSSYLSESFEFENSMRHLRLEPMSVQEQIVNSLA